MSMSCMWPDRHPVTGRFCRTIGYWIPRHGTYLCPHHVGQADNRARVGGAS